MTQKQKGKKNRTLYFLRVFNRFVMAMIVASGVYFVIIANDLSIKGFVLQELKIEVAEINEQNKDIKLKIMELESYDNITKKADDLKMVKVEKIDYILLGSEAVAKR